MARLYSNENFPQPVVAQLRLLGHDVVTVLESGHAGGAWPDEEVLRYALTEQRIVVTLNRKDFIKLHLGGAVHAGIVVCTFDADFVGQAERIHSAIQSIEDVAGQLLRVNRPRN